MWKIYDKPANATVLNLGFSIDPPDPVLSAFIMGTPVFRYPHLIRRVVTSGGFANERSTYLAYDDMGSDELENAEGIEPDEVEIYHEVFGTSFIKQFLFDEIVYDYSLSLLKEYKDHKGIQDEYARWMVHHTSPDYLLSHIYSDFNANWGVAMEEELQKLKQKNEARWKNKNYIGNWMKYPWISGYSTDVLMHPEEFIKMLYHSKWQTKIKKI